MSDGKLEIVGFPLKSAGKLSIISCFRKLFERLYLVSACIYYIKIPKNFRLRRASNNFHDINYVECYLREALLTFAGAAKLMFPFVRSENN